MWCESPAGHEHGPLPFGGGHRAFGRWVVRLGTDVVVLERACRVYGELRVGPAVPRLAIDCTFHIVGFTFAGSDTINLLRYPSIERPGCPSPKP